MKLSKGDIMKKLGMDTGVDSALPAGFVSHLDVKHNIHDIVFHFVMDYRNGANGILTPITLTGLHLLDRINDAMGWDLPHPPAVVDHVTGSVWTKGETP